MNKKAFTLIELLIAISLSSFIILGVLQGFRSVQQMLTRTQIKLQANRVISLSFNQMERDFNTIFIPNFSTTTTTTQATSLTTTVTGKRAQYFVAETYGDEGKTKIEGRNLELLKLVSFVNTNPLQIWGEKRIRIVRVGYELIKNKEKSKRDKIIYDLYRKETLNLENEKLKILTEPGKQFKTISGEKEEIRTYVIAENLSGAYFTYLVPKKKEKKDSPEPEEPFERSQKWGDIKKRQNVLPQQVEILITSEKSFGCTIPLLLYKK